ncbi:MAG: response regulator transcription factor [Fermentimonas sp.]|nr:response regulator transcription factor [Fermentimonas sp.]
MSKIRVVIVDDHKMLVEGLRDIINETEVIEIVGVAHDAENCRKYLSSWKPDVLMLDIGLPDISGIDFCKELKNNYPHLKILALTSHNEYAMVKQMLDNGASGYLVKNAESREVIEGIKTVYNGDTFLSHEVDLLMKKRSENAIWLTDRERELLKLVSEGYTNAEIADKIFLSPETVRGYRKNLLYKLEAKNTAVLVKIAMEQRLI